METSNPFENKAIKLAQAWFEKELKEIDKTLYHMRNLQRCLLLLQPCQREETYKEIERLNDEIAALELVRKRLCGM